MDIHIIISTKIEELGFEVRDALAARALSFSVINKWPHDLTNDDLQGIAAEFIVVLGIHSLADAPKRLCVHPCGNWDARWPITSSPKRDLGGEERTLAMSSGMLLCEAFRALCRQQLPKGFIASMECTHHGPAVMLPIIFLEIGCSPTEWDDPEAQETIFSVLGELSASTATTTASAILVGGDHYLTNIHEHVRRGIITVSHCCPSSQIQHFNEAMLREAIAKTREKEVFVVIDVRTAGQETTRIRDICAAMGVPVRLLHELG